MKGLILCAGNGSRLKPFSEVKPKGLLPVMNKPILFYCLEKLAELRIQEIGIVIKPEHRQLFLDEVGTGSPWGVRITYIEQAEPLGIADAVKQARPFIGQSSFMLLLGDNLIAQSLERLSSYIQNEDSQAAVMLGRVANPQDFGIAEIEGERIVRLEEKPKEPKSDLAILGAYAFKPSIFDAIHAIEPSARGEYEITDAIQWLLNQGYTAAYCVTDQNYSDVGTLERWLEANRWMLERYDGPGGSDAASDAAASGNRLIPPVCIDPSAELTNCTVGPYVTVGPGVKLAGCHIEDSILLEGARLIDPPYPIVHAVVSLRSAYNIPEYGGEES